MFRKTVVLIYLVFLGFSWVQFMWFFGVPTIGGFVLTPSAHPYIPPFSLVITKPNVGACEGWSVKLVNGQFFGMKVYLPVVHYFARVGSVTYEYFNYYVPSANLYDYVVRIIDPKWVAIPYSGKCVAEVVAVVPTPVVLFIMIVALVTKIYYRGRRVW